MPIIDLNQPDLWFTVDGDLLIDASGDLKDTRDSGNDAEGIRQQVLHRVIGENNSWRLHPEVTAGLEKYLGQSLDDELLSQIEFDIRAALTFDKYVNKQDIVVKALELVEGVAAIMVYIAGVEQEHPVLTMAYNVRNGEVLRIR